MSARPTRWRPIATAPKDAQILLLYPSSTDERRPMVWQGYVDTVGSAFALDADWGICRVFPTHWQPPPAPPARLPRGYLRHG